LLFIFWQGITDPARLSDASFFKKILREGQQGQQKVSVSAARCLGLILKVTAEEQRPELVASMRQLLDAVLSDLAGAGAAEERLRFLRLLYGVQRAYPDILADFAGQFLYGMKARQGEELSLCLEMLITYASRLVQETYLLLSSNLGTGYLYLPVLVIRDILGRNRMRIRILGSVPLTN
jgi:hypothetical protein